MYFILGEHMETLVLSYAKKWKDTLNLCVQSPAEKSLQSGRTTLKKSIKPMVHPKYCNSPPTLTAHANFVTSPTQISHFSYSVFHFHSLSLSVSHLFSTQ